MARQKGMLNLSGNIEVNAGAPFDARDIVPTKADLTVASNFPYAYVGMETYVVAEDKKYRYMGGGVETLSNWAEVGSGGGTSYAAGDGIVIDNDEISVDEMASTDMTEIVTPKPSVMSRRFKYSTDEQVIGTWVDGKPLYQKTVYMNRSDIGTNVLVDDSIDKITNMNGVAYWGIYTLPIPHVSTQNINNQISVWIESVKYIKVLTGSIVTGTIDCYVTIRYTKTTD